jgi:hypothetical protein
MQPIHFEPCTPLDIENGYLYFDISGRATYSELTCLIYLVFRVLPVFRKLCVSLILIFRCWKQKKDRPIDDRYYWVVLRIRGPMKGFCHALFSTRPTFY